jgi:hypothetical protein
LSCGPNSLVMLLTSIDRDSNSPSAPPEKVVMDIEMATWKTALELSPLEMSLWPLNFLSAPAMAHKVDALSSTPTI